MEQKIAIYPINIEPMEEGGYFAKCSILQGCHSEGETFAEAVSNIQDVIRAHIDCRRFVFYREAKGSHEIWRRDIDGRQTTLYNHGNKNLKRRTFKAIMKDFGIRGKEFGQLRRSK